MEKDEPGNTDLEQELEALYRKVASTGPQEDSSHPLPQLETFTAASEEPEIREQASDRPRTKKEAPPKRFLFIAIGLFFFLALLALVAVFFWPTIYHYESLALKEKVYPIRINKLTGEAAYFNGVAWLTPPVPEPAKKPVSGNLNIATAVIPSEPINAKDQAEKPSERTTTTITRDKGDYVIQIKAFPENKKEEAHVFMEDIKKRVPDVQMKTVHIQGHGLWYRIWVGNYVSAKEATQGIKNLKLSDSFPDCFIRMRSEE
jgi:hypothetical protein